MSSQYVANIEHPAEYPLKMLERIHLSTNPHAVCQEYGFDFDELQQLDHFNKQLESVQASMFLDGRITTALAGAALHTVVEKIAYRVTDDRTPTNDLVKAAELFMKVKNNNPAANAASGPQTMSLVINIPAIGDQQAKTISITANQPEAEPETTDEPTDAFTIILPTSEYKAEPETADDTDDKDA